MYVMENREEEKKAKTFLMVENKRIMIPLLSYLNLSLILSIIAIVGIVAFKAFPKRLLNAR